MKCSKANLYKYKMKVEQQCDASKFRIHSEQVYRIQFIIVNFFSCIKLWTDRSDMTIHAQPYQVH